MAGKAELTEALAAAIKALQQFEKTVHDLDRDRSHAEDRAAAAEMQAAKDREARGAAEGKVDGLERKVIYTAGRRDAEIAELKASNEVLSQRDREARDELDRLRHLKTPDPRGINSRLRSRKG
jgi:chromosome segregation ATPase